jgi:hypothetical protein
MTRGRFRIRRDDHRESCALDPSMLMLMSAEAVPNDASRFSQLRDRQTVAKLMTAFQSLTARHGWRVAAGGAHVIIECRRR